MQLYYLMIFIIMEVRLFFVEKQVCNICNKNKKIVYFHKDKSKSNGYSKRCVECKNDYQKELRKRKKKGIPIQGIPDYLRTIHKGNNYEQKTKQEKQKIERRTFGWEKEYYRISFWR